MTEPRTFSNLEEVSIHKRRAPDPELLAWAESLGQTTGQLLVIKKVPLAKSTGRSSVALFAVCGKTFGIPLDSGEVFLALSEPFVFHERVYWDALYKEEMGEVWTLFKGALEPVSP